MPRNEAFYTVGLELINEPGVVYAHEPELSDGLFSLLEAFSERRGRLAVVREGEEGLKRHGVYGVISYERLDVLYVAIERVLGPGRCPKEPLGAGPGLLQVQVPLPREELGVLHEGEL